MSKAAKAAGTQPGISKAKSRRKCWVCTLYALVYCNQQTRAEGKVKWDSSKVEVVAVDEENEAVEDFVEVAQKFFGASR